MAIWLVISYVVGLAISSVIVPAFVLGSVALAHGRDETVASVCSFGVPAHGEGEMGAGAGAELAEAHRVERSEKRKFKILHVTKILNFIFLTHCNRTDKPMD